MVGGWLGTKTLRITKAVEGSNLKCVCVYVCVYSKDLGLSRSENASPSLFGRKDKCPTGKMKPTKHL